MSEWTPASIPPEKSGAYLVRCVNLEDPEQQWLALAMRVATCWIEMLQGKFDSVLADEAVLYWAPVPAAP